MEAPPVTVLPVTGGTINMMEYLLQGKFNHFLDKLILYNDVPQESTVMVLEHQSAV